MSTEPDLSFHPAMNEICRGVMDCIGTQAGDTPAKTARRTQMVADTMSSMLPLNPLETMLAGQCVMFDQLVRDATRDVMRGLPEDVKLRIRPQICAAGRMLLASLAKFQQLQANTVARLGGRLETPAASAEVPRAAVRRPESAQTAAPADDRPAPTQTQTQTPVQTPTETPAHETPRPKPQAPVQPRQPAPAAPPHPAGAPDNEQARSREPAELSVVERDLSRILAQLGDAEDETMIMTWRDPSHAAAAEQASPAGQPSAGPPSGKTSPESSPGQPKRIEELV
jgi:outer membrane biosynthesis protein TonB